MTHSGAGENQFHSLPVNFHRRTCHEGPEGEQSSTLSLTSALDGSGWSTSLPGRFAPGKYPVPNVQEVALAPMTVRTGA